jgi:hypothetical protein
MMFVRRLIVLPALLSLILTTACSKKPEAETPVAAPVVSFNHPKAALGSPVEVSYAFSVPSGAPKMEEDYRVMVHFLDADEELMWTDDHQPEVPTSKWTPGQTVKYTRTMFVPIYPYVGEATVQVGLYSPKDNRRLALVGTDAGQRAYNVAKLQLLPQTENVFLIFKDGWHPAEVAPENSTVEWQWTKKSATIAFRNPRRDIVFYLHADNPGSAFSEPQNVQILLNGTPADSFTILPKQDHVQRTRLTAAQLGTAEMAEVRIDVDKTYVPALLPAANSRDSRELGIRVFHAFVEPQ